MESHLPVSLLRLAGIGFRARCPRLEKESVRSAVDSAHHVLSALDAGRTYSRRVYDFSPAALRSEAAALCRVRAAGIRAGDRGAGWLARGAIVVRQRCGC